MEVQTDQTTHRTSYAGRWRVLTDKFELRQGSEFTVEDAPVKHGDLALFAIGGDDCLLPGRYHSTCGDLGAIAIPGHLLRITDKVPVRIVGKVKPLDRINALMDEYIVWRLARALDE